MLGILKRNRARKPRCIVKGCSRPSDGPLFANVDDVPSDLCAEHNREITRVLADGLAARGTQVADGDKVNLSTSELVEILTHG